MNIEDNIQQGNKDKIDAIAEQWVNLVFAHIEYKKQNKKEHKNGKTRN